MFTSIQKKLEFIICLFVFLYVGHDAIVIYCSVFVLCVAFMCIHFFIHSCFDNFALVLYMLDTIMLHMYDV